MRSLALVIACVALSACEEPEARDETRVVPAGHPCPELAFTPSESRRWDDQTIAPLALRLPTPVGQAVRVTQGNDGVFSHFGAERFAWDFGVELGTPVAAAAGGVVVWVEDESTEFGAEAEFQQAANFVVLDHGGGLFTSYVHLAAGSAMVAAGDVVDAGAPLALTGLSGQMTGPHLHFQVENVWSESVPARFAEPGGCTLLPLQDEWVDAWEPPLAASDTLSSMPGDAFAEDGVVDLAGLPGRLFERGERPRVSGRTTLAGATEVWLLILPPGGGDALFARALEVHDGAFAGGVSWSAVPPGQYGIALVAGTGGAVSVPRSVRAAIID